MSPRNSPLLRSLRHFRAHRRRLVGLSLISTVGAFAEAFSYAIVVPLASVAMSGESSWHFSLLGLEGHVPVAGLFAVALVAVLGQAALTMVEEYLTGDMLARYTAAQQMRALDALLHAPWSVQSREQEGRLQDVVTTYLGRARAGLINLTAGMRAFTSFAIFLAGAVLVGGGLALVVVGVIAALFFVLRPLSRLARENSFRMATESPRFAGALAQSVRMAREIRLFRAAAAVKERAGRSVEALRKMTLRQRLLTAATPTVYQAVGLLVVLAGIGYVLLADVGQPEALAATAILMLKALQYGRSIQREYHACNDMLPFVEKLDERLAALEAVGESDAGVSIDRLERVSLRHVGFAYTQGEAVLRDISFDLGPGESLGIIGPSGSGKSTLLQLLLRLRLPTQGEILANGSPAEAIARASWYERVAFVPQEAHLFSDTILQNIQAYRPEISEADARRAANLAGVAEEIEAMPEGYLTHAGEQGGRLSGGQRQRLCIARALAGEPDILLFDEPTSALDGHSELAVQQTLRTLRGRTTLVIVAHRLTTLSVCDQILVLRDGRVEAYGPRESLEREAGYFREVLGLAGLQADG